jgi:DNA polymerase
MATPSDPPPTTLTGIEAAIQICRRCDLWRGATQGVAGEGPAEARLMIVGEQPGDAEDRAGKPFVGPAGRILDEAMQAAGVPRDEVLVTNAVKHFKNEPRGKRRLHKTPNAGEIIACRWWLDRERSIVRPRVILAMGGTAAFSVLGRKAPILASRGKEFQLADQTIGMLTLHPSAILRIPDRTAKAEAFERLAEDLTAAWRRATV